MAVHGPGQFTGDVAHLTGSRSIVTAVARVDSQVHALLRNPSNRDLAEALGIRRPLGRTVYDLAVVGCGLASRRRSTVRPRG